jgi:predicted phosphodiesterase
MRIAVFADIHGNLPALEAVLGDLATRDTVALIINLGDCVSGPLWPAETCALLMQQAWPTVRGNHDRIVAFDERQGMGPSDAFARDALDEAQCTWLGAIPVTAAVNPDVCAFHGLPSSDTRYLLETIEQGRLAVSMPAKIATRLSPEALAKRVLLCGHSHQPRMIQLASGPLIVNPGSIGCPAYSDDHGLPHVSEAGSPHARYAIVTLREETIDVDLIAVGYDHAAAARRAEANHRSDWAHALSTGFSVPNS